MRIIALVLLSKLAFAQVPEGEFLDKNFKIGQVVRFQLGLKHANNQDILFPDSKYNFYPFQLVNIQYFPTETHANQSYEKVVYSLVTYEIDSVCTLSLPVGLANKKLFSKPVRINKVKLFEKNQNLKKIPIKSKIVFFDVPSNFNFPKFVYYAFVLFLSMVVFFFAFRKTLLNFSKRYFFYQKHKTFVAEFKRLSKNTGNVKNISNALILWKNQMEKMLDKPFSTKTTKEITETLENEQLNDALKEFDASIYGGAISSQMPSAFKVLLAIAIEYYETESEKLKENLTNKYE